MKILSIFFILIIILSGKSFGETNINLSPNGNGVEFISDNIKVDEKNKIVTASGNVIIKSENREIIADKVVYDQKLDKAIATGEVLLKESKRASTTLTRIYCHPQHRLQLRLLVVGWYWL